MDHDYNKLVNEHLTICPLCVAYGKRDPNCKEITTLFKDWISVLNKKWSEEDINRNPEFEQWIKDGAL